MEMVSGNLKTRHLTLIVSKKIVRMNSPKLLMKIVLIILLSNLVFSYWNFIDINEEFVYGVVGSSTRSNNENNINFESAILIGTYSDERAEFVLNISFFVFDNETDVMIPLIGPPPDAMVNNFTIDNIERDLLFNSNYYYFSGLLSIGHHYLEFKFRSKMLDKNTKSLNFSFYGPVLNYLIEFNIQKKSEENIHILESNNGMINEEYDNIKITWEYYATIILNWNLEWIKYKVPKPKDVSCEFEAEVLITDKKVKIDVEYTLEFTGFALEDMEITLDSQTNIISSSQGVIESFQNKVIIHFQKLVNEKLEIKLVFEKNFNKDISITIPRPINSKINGEVSIFSALNVVVNQTKIENSTLVSYSGTMKNNVNFIGNYHFTELSILDFYVHVRESLVTVEIIESLYPTFNGYDIETWVLFTFFGSSPNSITIDIPILDPRGKPQKPLMLVDPEISLPILNYNWNSNLNRLTLWLYSNMSGEYKFGLKWNLFGNNVSM
jgi:hypothetical protein